MQTRRRSLPRARAFATVCGLAIAFTARAASAQIAVDAGIDGGFSIVTPDQDFVDASVQRDNPVPTIALGIDAAMYYLFNDELGLGLAIAPAFFAGGHNPTAGINFAISPRLMWKPGPARFTFEGGLVLSAWGELCRAYDSDLPEGCEPVRPYEPAGFGFGTAVAATFPIYQPDPGMAVEVGPVARFQWARFHYEDNPEEGFGLPVFQLALALRLTIDAPAERR